MRQATGILTFQGRGPGLHPITGEVTAWLEAQDAGDGLLTLFCRHTSASLTIQENCDPDVLRDLDDAFGRLAPRAVRHRHSEEGLDDMPAHIRTALSGVQLSVPVIAGRLALGTWQGIFLWEHRDRPRERQVALHLLAD